MIRRLRSRLACTCAAAVLLTAAVAAAQARDPSVLRGQWTATAGGRNLEGQWTARAVPGKDAAQGSWALIDQGRIVAEGTWAAEKGRGGWRGTWSARVQARGGAAGPAYSGTWQASLADASISTLAGMLQHSLAKDVTGTWRAGSRSGAWRLAAPRR